MASDRLTRLQWLRDVAEGLYTDGYLAAAAWDDTRAKINADIDRLLTPSATLDDAAKAVAPAKPCGYCAGVFPCAIHGQAQAAQEPAPVRPEWLYPGHRWDAGPGTEGR
jgi:hypothetical protein